MHCHFLIENKEIGNAEILLLLYNVLHGIVYQKQRGKTELISSDVLGVIKISGKNLFPNRL